MARIQILVAGVSTYADAIQASGFSVSLNSFAPDTLQFTIPRSATSALLFADKSTIELYQDSTRIFYGVIRATPVEASALSERHIVNASGGWYGLECWAYEQLAKRYVGGTLQDVMMSEVRIGRTSAGNALMTCGAVIKEAVDYAAAKGALLQAGTISDGPTFPEEDAIDLTPAEIVFRVCRWMPDMVSGFDHATGRMNVSSTPSSTVSIDLHSTAYRVDRADPAPRTDLIVPGVRIDYQIAASVNGKTVLSLVRETAGQTEASGAVKHTMQIRGPSVTKMQQVQHIVIAPLPTDIDLDWWKSHCPDLADARIQNLALANITYDTLPTYPHELLEGSIQDWMLEETTGHNYSLHAVETKVSVEATYDQIVDGKTIKVKGRKYTATITTTDATTRSYSRFSETLSGGEYYPSGLAASLYAAGSKTWWDGQVVISGAECQLGIFPGQALNILNGKAEWATMAARIVAVQHNLDTGRTSIQVGPPRQMTLGDLADQLRRNRRRNTPISTNARLNPDVDDNSDLPRIMLSSHPVRKEASAGLGLMGEETDLVIDVQLNLTTDMLEVKKRKGYVVWAESEPSWETVTNWDVINCDTETTAE